MKLLYITNKFAGTGGIQRMLSVKANYLVEHFGYNVTIAATNQDATAQVFYSFHPHVKILSLNPERSVIKYWASYKKLIHQLVTQEQPDVVIMCDNGIKSFLLPKMVIGVPLVYESHITRAKVLDDFRKGFAFASLLPAALFYGFTNRLSSKFDKVVTVTEDGAAEFKHANVQVIPNPLWFTTAAQSSLSSKKVVMLARHSHQKGFDRLFKAWQIISGKHPGWELDIYGDRNMNYDIQQMATDLKLKKVNFYDAVSDISLVFTEVSINLLTSRYEGFGLVIIEAAAFGVPTIAFDCPVGPRDIITNGKDGLLVKDGDSNAFANAVMALIQNSDLRLKMGNNAKQMAARYAIAPIMKQWDDLFKALKRT